MNGTTETFNEKSSVPETSIVELSDSGTSATQGSLPDQPEGEHSVSETCVKILEIIFDYALNKFSDTKERLEAGRPKFLSVIDRFVAAGTRVEMCLPAFPFKSANKVYKVLGSLPDKAEEIALERLNTMCMRIGEIYAPGARCTIISDGVVYNDLLSISDRETWAYGQALRAMAEQKGFQHIVFSRIRDFVDFPLPEVMKEITYVANVTNFRRFLFNHFGKDDLDIEDEIAANPDTKMTYLGYRRFLESDLKYIFPLGNGRTSNGYRRDVKYLAKQMLIRGFVSSTCHTLTLSKFVALMADGEWLSAPMGEFRKEPRMKIIYEDGRPSYFKETEGNDRSAENAVHEATTNTNGGDQDVPLEEEKVIALAKSISAGGSRDHDGRAVNPFVGSENPQLDPNSSQFSVRAWLQAVMNIASRDPERYPKGVAGVAYRNLSTHGVGQFMDYQKTFGNYLLGLINGCSTFLKTISGETDGFHVGEDSYLNYQGIPNETMHKDFRGECIYQAEVDAHFPQLTVGQTLDFAARARLTGATALVTVYQASQHIYDASLGALSSNQIEEFDRAYPIGGSGLDEFKKSRRAVQAISQGFQRLKGDMGIVLAGAFFNAIMALVIGSIFYNLPNNTAALYHRGALLFFAILLASFASALEIMTLYAQRPIVEKQAKYAFYHPFAEAIASMICDLPNKVLTALGFNLALYFMTNLRRTPGHFFVFLLFAFTFAYAFEALMINEFHDRTIDCSKFIPDGPGYGEVSPENRICATTGAAAGASFVDGDTYLAVNFRYVADHLWRNLGIMIVLMVFGCAVYLVATEYISAKKSKGEILIFRRRRMPHFRLKMDEEVNADDRVGADILAREMTTPHTPGGLQDQTAVFQWSDVNYDIKVKKNTRRLLDQVDGWVKPGTLTALMGVTGAGKTTLLDVLASRATIGVVSGEFLVNGRPRDTGFQRKTGYVQQQDLHLATTTVREALSFSALLRQPRAIPHSEKLKYVEEIIDILEMRPYADAAVGVPGEGLNIEQRKRLTIGVELAAKPALLFFLDEPTSGLDSQTAWSICTLLRKLAGNGQAILCTIHQPSAHLFQVFDRLLLLAMGGKTLYFGEIGSSSQTVTSYFERNGARPCSPDENPAEWILEIAGATPRSESTQDWSAIWNSSEERKAVKAELAWMKESLSQQPQSTIGSSDLDALQPFAASFGTQLFTVLKRVFQQYWCTPLYLYSKITLCLFSGLQNQMYAIFMLLVIFANVCSQIMPHYASQRTLYDARESLSKTYSWKVFVLSNMLVEIPWNSFSALLIFVSWYYPIGLRQNAVGANEVHERGALMFLFILAFLNFAGTFTNMIMSAVDSVEAAGNITNLLHSLSLIFCGSNDTNVFLETVSAKYEDRWRNFGIFWVYIIFNIAAALGLFWLTKVPKKRSEQSINDKTKEEMEEKPKWTV
ncbi:ATP-binding cassette, subfamily G (WHITE), member 2, PDR [Purpureocillium lavendulum]|uniref:ATP-binding cassette, subfamily G (WHITE), member 2, PDR n=1 Tax=Purpureocillium lavendulum TaxID=1247861 RepID=A0AB34FCA1_9HYPO|nr:ATP-binding cassette, subfamily G (WHITE), member 2, PDR [Purpureocillium lavendulum]